MEYQRLLLIGNATDNAKRCTSRKGDVKYTCFRLGVGDAWKRSTSFPVKVFDPLGKTLAKHITRGRWLFVEGRIVVDDKDRCSVIADRIKICAQGSGAAR